jgi:hypothetical protein
LLIRHSEAAPELPGFSEIMGANVSGQAIHLVVSRLEVALGLRLTPSGLPRDVELNARHFANSKYGMATWTKRR